MTEKESRVFYYTKKFQETNAFLATKYNRVFSSEFLTSLLGHFFDSNDVHTLLIFSPHIEEIDLTQILTDEIESVIAEVNDYSDEFNFILSDNIQKAKVKDSGYQWMIHKNDADPFPSNPHAHEYTLGIKLHLGTGDMYRKKQIIGSVSKKTLNRLRDKITKSGINLETLPVA